SGGPFHRGRDERPGNEAAHWAVVESEESVRRGGWTVLVVAAIAFTATSCGKRPDTAVQAAAIQTIAVKTAKAVVRDVPASFDETGTFMADESSDIAPPVAGRVIRTPVDAGTFVKE